jgi:hypothetical protein
VIKLISFGSFLQEGWSYMAFFASTWWVWGILTIASCIYVWRWLHNGDFKRMTKADQDRAIIPCLVAVAVGGCSALAMGASIFATLLI